MPTLIEDLRLNDYGYLAGWLVIFAGFAIIRIFVGRGPARRANENVKRLERQIRELEKKVNVLFAHQGIELPPPPASGLSPEVERLARDSKTKLAAIKLYREENPGISLREANERINIYGTNERARDGQIPPSAKPK